MHTLPFTLGNGACSSDDETRKLLGKDFQGLYCPKLHGRNFKYGSRQIIGILQSLAWMPRVYQCLVTSLTIHVLMSGSFLPWELYFSRFGFAHRRSQKIEDRKKNKVMNSLRTRWLLLEETALFFFNIVVFETHKR